MIAGEHRRLPRQLYNYENGWALVWPGLVLFGKNTLSINAGWTDCCGTTFFFMFFLSHPYLVGFSWSTFVHQHIWWNMVEYDPYHGV